MSEKTVTNPLNNKIKNKTVWWLFTLDSIEYVRDVVALAQTRGITPLYNPKNPFLWPMYLTAN